MIPELHVIRVMLVERTDYPGRLGVAVRGGRYVCPLPAGYDDDTRVNVDDMGYVLVAHPKLPPLLCDPTTGTVQPIAMAVDPKRITRPRPVH